MKWTWKLPDNERILRAAAVLALVALVLMIWSVFDKTVWPVLIALSAGQVVGTLSFALFLLAVGRDLRVRATLRSSKRRD